MSRGFGKMQRWILDDLNMYPEARSTNELFDDYMAEAERSPPPRSARHSIARALRKLKAAGKIELRDGRWRPVGNWQAHDAVAERRKEIAYHESGHAVIGLAGQLPIGFVTIRPRAGSLGHVSSANGPRKIGYIVKDYQIVTHLKTDAFGNEVPQRKATDSEHHAEVRMCIGGPMAEAHLMGDGTQWRRLASPADMRIARWHRRQLGERSKKWGEYEAETHALICEHWEKISSVAARLLDDESISGADVDAICCKIVRRKMRREQRLSVVGRQHLSGRRRRP